MLIGEKTKKFLNARMLLMLATGMSSGLPLLLTGSTLQAWLKNQHVDLTTIGLFAFAGLPFTLKFLWAPWMDGLQPPLVKNRQDARRGWTVWAQLGVVVGLVGISQIDPGLNPWLTALAALWINFFAATQDINLDAYRREILTDEQLGLGHSVFVGGYRVGLLIAGALALFLADRLPWSTVYLLMAAIQGLGMVVIALAPSPALLPRIDTGQKRDFWKMFIEPLAEYFRRDGAWIVLLFIFFYKLGDNIAVGMATPFYLENGFTKTEIATIAKSVGVISILLGGLAGGVVLFRMKLSRALLAFGLLQSLATAGFVLLVLFPANQWLLAGVIGAENFTAGMGQTALLTLMSKLSHRGFTATQFALLSSFMGLPRILSQSASGFMAQQLGWGPFFVACSIIAFCGVILIRPISRLIDAPEIQLPA